MVHRLAQRDVESTGVPRFDAPAGRSKLVPNLGRQKTSNGSETSAPLSFCIFISKILIFLINKKILFKKLNEIFFKTKKIFKQKIDKKTFECIENREFFSMPT